MTLKHQRQLIWSLLTISLLLNYYFWLSHFSGSYALSDIFQKTFIVVMPFASLVAYSQIDSGSYLPSLRKLGLPWQLSYFLEKFLHLILCIIAMSSFLLLLSALLIRGAPIHYTSAQVGNLTQESWLHYRFYTWQPRGNIPEAFQHRYSINQKQYEQLTRNRTVQVRVQHNLAGSSVTIIK